MSSIQQIQIKNLLEFITQYYLVNGINPTEEDIHRHLNEFFSKYPAGNPVLLERGIFVEKIKSDEDLVNDFMASVIFNLDTLYEACLSQIEQTMLLNSLMRAHLERLKIRRKVAENKIDDFLLGIFNSDGYFYSRSDDLSDTGSCDLSMTTAFIDTNSGVAMLSPVSSLSRPLSSSSIGEPSVLVKDSSGRNISFSKKTHFNNAKDGLTNTAWYIEALSDSDKLIATITIPIQSELVRISKIDLTPFGAKDVQCALTVRVINEDGTIGSNVPFSSTVKKSSDKMVFISDNPDRKIDQLVIKFIKTDPDYLKSDPNNNSNVFIFGIKEISILEQYYEQSSTFVSNAFGIPDALKNDAVIDAVSLVVEDSVPTNTFVKYYVAENVESASSISEFNWKEIEPVTGVNAANQSVVRFFGSSSVSPMIRKEKRDSTDILMIPLGALNPRSDYVVGSDIYRVCPFDQEFLSNTIKLEEGINTTRVHFVTRTSTALDQGFSFWNDILNSDTSDYETEYGEIDTGHGFFWGSVVAEKNRSVYVETFLYTDREYDVFLKQCSKLDPNSKLWALRVFLNGKEIGNMPVGTNTLNMPWKFKKGKNHIVVMIDIPDTNNSYDGTFELMMDDKLTNYGLVKLDDWTYVDFYQFSNNKINTSKVFTIHNKEIITRKKPTNNFRLTFKKSTSVGPESIRLRADFSRNSNSPKVTPYLDSYRVRFSYV